MRLGFRQETRDRWKAMAAGCLEQTPEGLRCPNCHGVRFTREASLPRRIMFGTMTRARRFRCDGCRMVWH